jgi:hypothetical protein
MQWVGMALAGTLQRGGGDVGEVWAHGAGELEEDAASDMTTGWPAARCAGLAARGWPRTRDDRRRAGTRADGTRGSGLVLLNRQGWRHA